MYDPNNIGATPESKAVADLLRASLNQPAETTTTTDTDCPPLEVLPPAAKMLVEEAAKALGIDIGYAISGIILATAVATGATHRLEIKRGQYEYPRLYMALVGIPGSNKSRGLSFGLSPINRLDSERQKRYNSELAEYEAAIKEGTTDNQPPTKSQAVMTDFSQEVLAIAHEANPKGLVIFNDELMGHLSSMNRYNSGGEEQFYLSAWSGAPISVNRVSRKSIRIDNPVISIAGTIQPGPLKIFAGPKAENGYSHRYLFTWPENKEKPKWNELEIPDSLISGYYAAIERIESIGFKTDDEELGEGWNEPNTPYTVKLTSTAKRLMIDFKNGPNKTLADFAENDQIRGMHVKFDSHLDRLTLVLQMLWYGYEEEGKDVITEATARRGIKLTEWYRTQSLKVHKYLYDRSPLDELSRDEQRVYRDLPTTFETSQLIMTGHLKAGWSRSKAERKKKDWDEKDLISKQGHGLYAKCY